MKTISKQMLFSALMLLFLISCKKNKPAEPENPGNQHLKENADYNSSITPGLGNIFYEKSLLPNQASQIFARIAYKGDSVFFSGTTNAEGKISGLKSVIVARANNEYVVTQYLPNSATLMYSIKGGVKGRLVIKTQIYSENAKEITLLDYDWKTGLAQVMLSSYFLNGKLTQVQSLKQEDTKLTANEVLGLQPMLKTDGLAPEGKIPPVSLTASTDKRLALLKSNLQGNAPPNNNSLCATPIPDDSDRYLDKSMQFIACNGTHPINQPILDLHEKIKSLPNKDQILEEFELLKSANSFFENAFNSIKDRINNYKFENTNASKIYNWLLSLIDDYKASQQTDLKLSLVLNESDTELYEGTDEYLKLTLLVSDIKKNVPYTEKSVLVKVTLSSTGTNTASYEKNLYTSKTDGKVSFLIKADEIANLGFSQKQTVTSSTPDQNVTHVFDVDFVWLKPTLSIVSGNNQVGELGKKLPLPLKVKVVDQNNKPIKNWPISWAVIEGNGFITSEDKTDEQGFASANWTTGSSGEQQVQATVKNNDGSTANGSPVLFNTNKPNYVLERQLYNPDYNQMVGLKEYKNGDAFETPNGLIDYFKVKLDGRYVKQSNQPGAGDLVIQKSFYFPNYPVSENDHKIPNFEFTFQDPQRGVASAVTLNLTLSNEIYRKVVGHSIRYIPAKYAGGENSAVTLTFGHDGTYTMVTKSGMVTKYNYTMFRGANTSSVQFFVTCASGPVLKNSIGYIELGHTPNVTMPGKFFIIYNDGSASLSGSYPCPSTSDNEKITVILE